MPLKVILFLIIYFSLAFWALYKDPIYGVCGYIFVYCIYSPYVWWGDILLKLPIRYSLVMALCVLMGMVFQTKRMKYQPKNANYALISNDNLEKVFYLFLFVSLSSLIIGVPPTPESYDLLIKMIKVFIFIAMFIRVVKTFHEYDLVVATFIITGVFLSILAYQAQSSSALFEGNRLNLLGGADFAGSNEFAIHLSAVLCFMGVTLLKKRKWILNLSMLIGIAFVLNAIVMTRARATFVALFVAGILSVIIAPKIYRIKIIACLVLGTILFIILMDPGFRDRMDTIAAPAEDASASSRFTIWDASYNMFYDYPLGVGIGNFKKMVGQYSANPNIVGKDAHSTFVRCYSELGLHGFLIFITILFMAYKKLRSLKILVRGSQIELKAQIKIFSLSLAILVYLVGGLTHTRLYIEGFWLLIAMTICLENAIMNDLAEQGNMDLENNSLR